MDMRQIRQPSASDARAPQLPDISVNIAVAWTSLAVGAITGMVMGLWSFNGPAPVPAMIGEYGDLPRRLLRLGHIAFFGLGLLNILMSRQLAAARQHRAGDLLALRLMNFGNIVLPPSLMAAAFFEPVKYVASLPATAITAALCIAAYSAVQDARGLAR